MHEKVELTNINFGIHINRTDSSITLSLTQYHFYTVSLLQGLLIRWVLFVITIKITREKIYTLRHSSFHITKEFQRHKGAVKFPLSMRGKLRNHDIPP